MTLSEVPDRALDELGRTEGGPDTLAFLVRDQDTRRLLLLRALLDAADAADPAVCSPDQRARLKDDWALLAASEDAPRPPGHPAASPARDRVHYPLTGPWALSCLRGLDRAPGPADPAEARQLALALGHFGALATVSAARAGLSFTTRLTAHDGTLNLPSLGSLRAAPTGDVPVEVTATAGRLTFHQEEEADVVVFLERGFGAWSGARAWTPAHALPGLTPGAAPMPLDDLDPYRADPAPHRPAQSGPTTLDDAERKRWLTAWSGTAAALRTGGEHRLTEALALLRCLVPLEMPPGARGHGGCSATRREAFGALLSSTPPSPAAFAATLVHELQHAKLAALSDALVLHQSDPEARYFAPWRPDPRPYDGLLQGAYAHLALADFFQRRALTPASRGEPAWTQHSRYRAQVGAVLPVLVGSPHLTVRGRRFVDQMVVAYERMAAHPAPRGHTARAEAYVDAARALWRQRQSSATRPNE
ncbi:MULTISPECIES: HEXXH motif-containing putative peptide modification protein [unclassified Streptomyces]|uniref:aKG-HExxH-type peptide beta-hydroxylase n=1 Tax=unclassified Streptomyces TaxID=2593676 RepID=UPI00278BE615|nr:MULTISPECIES: HEXXH motif-containing putative peptide modification protein [unclassified Streptomyces]